MILDRVPRKPVWAPSRALVEQSNLKKFQNWLFVKKGLYFRDYHDLWDWSVTDLEDFWESIWQFCDIKSHSIYWEVLVSSKKDFADSQWFTGATINYAEHIFRHKNATRAAFLYQSERESQKEMSWRELEKQVAAVAAYLRLSGVGVGDKVAAMLPNGPQAVVAFLATNAVGAVWTLCSPELDTNAIIHRFQQVQPKVLFAADGYYQNGQSFDKTSTAKALVSQLNTIKKTVLVPTLSAEAQLPKTDIWADVLKTPAATLEFTPVGFGHPLSISFDQEKPNKPRVIKHSVGGCLLEHLKTLMIHQNVKAGERFFWHGNTNDAAWNFSVASMLVGAMPLLYDGALKGNALWDTAEKAKINHVGTTSASLGAFLKEGSKLQGYKFNQLQSLTAMDAVMPAEVFDWIYQNVKKDVWVISFPYHTEIHSSSVGGCPTLPVFAGETQCRLLGCKLEDYSSKTNSVRTELGETNLSQPMPSMPLVG